MIGSLFSGYGGLELALSSVLGDEVAWHVEFDDAPSRILAHQFPGVPNYGDITTVDWATVPRVRVLAGGFPCQDVSLAGLRRGLKDGTRSGLWSEFARAIDALRPELVVIENVRGLLSAEANRGLESDPWDLGDRSARPALRALGAVLGDLADLGYDARWCGVRAAEAGAPHGRYRIFILAHPAGDSGRLRDGDSLVAGDAADLVDERGGPLRGVGAGAARPAGGADRHATENADDAARSERGESAPGQTAGGRSRADARGRGRASATDADGAVTGRGEAGDVAGSTGACEGNRDQWQRDGDAVGDRGAASGQWGPYAPAVERWERVLGRVAPSPTEPTGKAESHRLSPRFVEWMMGLPDGWVTSPEIGLTRPQQLKALGNGVVPQQAALAIRMLLTEGES